MRYMVLSPKGIFAQLFFSNVLKTQNRVSPVIQKRRSRSKISNLAEFFW